MNRVLVAWIAIGVLGAACVVVGIGRGALTAAPGFDALKFAIAGVILIGAAIYKVVVSSRRR